MTDWIVLCVDRRVSTTPCIAALPRIASAWRPNVFRQRGPVKMTCFCLRRAESTVVAGDGRGKQNQAAYIIPYHDQKIILESRHVAAAAMSDSAATR